jgi:hypothetical protein
MSLSRRRFLRLAALGVVVPFLPAHGHGSARRRAREAVALSRVRLLDGPVRDSLTVNRAALLRLDLDRLLHMFRLTAGLPSTAEPLGGWEAPDNELRGHYTGHHLSALALLTAQTGDPLARERALDLQKGLAECQAALGTGYLSAFPEELFDRLRAGKPAWAPFYTLHKLLAGLLDVHEHIGSAESLEMAKRLALWVERYTQPLGDDAMSRLLEREYGGMNEVLYRLATVTQDERFDTLARRFNHERIFIPLAAGRDELTGLHVNTTIPKVIGALEGYQRDGDPALYQVATTFYRTVTESRSYVTGGTSNGESWNTPAGTLKGELSGYTQECCVSYNLMKLAHRLHLQDGDPRQMDDYERLLWNGILGVQHPSDGAKLYYVPLAGGYWKLYGTPLHDFWCCTGSMAEAHAKLGEAIYSESADGLGVELFISSTLRAGRHGVGLRQESSFPASAATRLTIDAAKPTHCTIDIRIPGWSRGGTATLNGKPLEAFAAPGGRLVVTRTWHAGDTLEITLERRLEAVELPGDPEHVALCYGPIVLAARLGREGLDAAHLRAPPTAPRSVPEYPLDAVAVPTMSPDIRSPERWLEPIPGKPLEFRVRRQPEIEFAPLYRLQDERFAVYLPVADAEFD